MMEVIQNKEGSYTVEVKSTSGNVLFQSLSYPSELKAQEVFQQIKDNVIFERKTNLEGEFEIHLKTENGEVIGRSNPYSSEAGMENGIKNLIKSL